MSWADELWNEAVAIAQAKVMRPDLEALAVIALAESTPDFTLLLQNINPRYTVEDLLTIITQRRSVSR
jgi:hypothetical protein